MEIEKITIRRATTKDFNKLINFFNIVDKDFVPPISERGSIAEYVKDMIKGKDCYAVILENPNKGIEGTISFREHWKGRTSAHIQWIAVHPKYRHIGIANLLLTEALNLLKQDKIKLVSTRTWSTNTASINLWREAGFKKIKVVKNDRGPGIDSIYFEKKL